MEVRRDAALVGLRPLTPKELEDLESFIRTTKDAKLRDRARMAYWFHKRNMTYFPHSRIGLTPNFLERP